MTSPRRPLQSGSTVLRATPLGRALMAAATHAASQLAPNGAPSSREVERELGRLCEVVFDLVERSSSPEAESYAPFARGHVEVFRRVFLSRLAEGHPKRANGQSVVAVLRALDAIRVRDDAATVHSDEDARFRNDALSGMLEIAHDMRSPLAAILLLVDPIRRGQYGPVTETQERQLALVYGAALSLSTLANDIIDAVRGEKLPEPAHHPFSVSGTMHDACAIVSPIAEEKGLELRQVYPTVDGRIGDSAAIHRVLLNLVSNALKYTERGSVTVGCSELGPTRVEFWVKDTGRGIPERVLGKLFDEFRPGPVGSRFYGSGLGLAICRRLVEKMGGALRVETAPEQGTRFSFAIDLPTTHSAPNEEG